MGRPHWIGPEIEGEQPPGEISDELKREILIWRPVMAGKVSLADVKSGAVNVSDLQKINSLMDLQAAAEQRERERHKS
jgi:hypothetical protein